MKQNSNHHHHYQHSLNDSFDSGTGGTGGGGYSSGQVTPSSPSMSSPSHLFPLSSGQRFKSGGGELSTGEGLRLPTATLMADASTQTQNPITTKPTMISRWTQTTNITPTHVRIPKYAGRMLNVDGDNVQNRIINGGSEKLGRYQHQPIEVSRGVDCTSRITGLPIIATGSRASSSSYYHRPSLQNYLLSEKRFAKGRYSSAVQQTVQQQQQQQGEDLYDQVYGSNNLSTGSGLVYGSVNNANNLYDQVAQERIIPTGEHNERNDNLAYYEDVYDGYHDDDDYFDEDDDYYYYYDDDLEDFDDESDDDEDFDADDEFGGEESVDEDEDEDDDDDDEDDEVEEEEVVLESDDMMFEQRLRVMNDHGVHEDHEFEREYTSEECEFIMDGQSLSLYDKQQKQQFVRGYQLRQQPLQLATKTSVKTIVTTTNNKQQSNSNCNNNNDNNQQQQVKSNQIVVSKQHQQSQNDGIRMSASFSAVDFKRNIAGRR